MPKITLQKIYTVELNQDEISYLICLLQNYPGPPEEEDASEKQMRCALFDAFLNAQDTLS